MSLTDIIAKRGIIKGNVTRFKTFLSKCTDNPKILNQLCLRLEKFKPCWDTFNAIQDQIELLDKESEEKNVFERSQFEDSYFELVNEAEQLIKQYNLGNTTEGVSDGNPVDTLTGNNSQCFTQSIQVKLPQINVPTFSGRYEDWLSFRELFTAIIDKNPTLDDVHKLYFLRQSLRGGSAANLIDSIELTAQNYETAWQVLSNRFHNERVIIECHVRALFDFPKVEKESSQALRVLLDNTNIHLRALEALNQPVHAWDTIIIHLLTSKLDLHTNKEWQSHAPANQVASLSEFTEFLNRRCQTLEAIGTTCQGKLHVVQHTHKHETSKTKPFSAKNNVAHYVTKQPASHNPMKCLICAEPHKIFCCPEFNKMIPKTRMDKVKKLNLCFNCLRPGHVLKDCQLTSKCKMCNKGHNTLLHDKDETNASTSSRTGDTSNQFVYNNKSLTYPTAVTNTSRIETHNLPQVLLSTALIDISDSSGSFTTCRALLDPGSSINIMSESLCQRLKLSRKRINTSIAGIGNVLTTANGCVAANIKSRYSSYENSLEFVVLSKISNFIPNSKINTSDWFIPKKIFLADPYFNKPARIDLLIGAEIFFELLCVGQIKLMDGYPVLQKTSLGWIISGKIPSNAPSATTFHCNATEDDISNQIERFWNIEELACDRNQRSFTGEEAICEQLFMDTVKRDDHGRFIVQLPTRPKISELGSSKETAMKRFYQLEKRLSRNKELRNMYCKFMREYEDLNHMQLVDPDTIQEPNYYIPHHCVFKDDSTTTKLRVVFDASCKTDNNISLNDCLMNGPVVQEDLFSIVIRFRKHLYAMTADIEKMYRQIRLSSEQTRYQLIFWRENTKQPLKTYKLLTVTYGTTSAPYLSTRSLKQLASDHHNTFCEAAETVISDFYVDDILTGADSLERAKKLQQQLTDLLKQGGFNLRKWCANDKEILKHLSPEDRETQLNYSLQNDDHTVKALGIYWNSQTDTFQYTVNVNLKPDHVTKRTILSEVSKLFDPLGLVSPVILKAKTIVQELWKLKLTWDESIPISIHNKWTQFINSLTRLSELRIPRHIRCKAEVINIQLHSFSDASETGYGACIYLRSKDTFGNIKVSLVCSKTRVAPLKQITLPRLELCGATLAAQLTQKALMALKLHKFNNYYWTDSTIVLSWLASRSSNWSTFISNRVAKIQRLSSMEEWRHVKGHENPADFASRGVTAEKLITSSLWWNGPHWLSGPSTWEQSHNIQYYSDNELPEHKPTADVCLITDDQNILQKYSSFPKLQRVIAYILRFSNNSKISEPEHRSYGPLSTHELQKATTSVLKIVQCEHFSEDYSHLKMHGTVPHKSKLISLSPFLDANNLIRVGGRLQQSEYPYDQKHPIILPEKSIITKLIIKLQHIKQLHAGPLALLASIRLKYWPINGRRITKQICHECITCFRVKPKAAEQLMGSLPPQRVQSARPFLHVGIDYCGPIGILTSHRRGASTIKGYIAVFICLATKAMHLELVQELTTKSFLAALQRFISRRGKPREIFSDNATNFVGAKNKLKGLDELCSSSKDEGNITETCAQENINWKFIPPRSPHFGGLWEAGVKSVKYHLVRIIGKASLTYEELNTTICRIEGCLNSRPISPLSSDPSDQNPLTPGHFLIGQPLTAISEENDATTNLNRLTRWQRINQLTQHFWNRWRKEYISELQSKVKWRQSSNNIKVGTLVMVHEDNSPPMNWKLGRILKAIPGADGKVRVVLIKTQSQTIKRAINKICPLPIIDNEL